MSEIKEATLEIRRKLGDIEQAILSLKDGSNMTMTQEAKIINDFAKELLDGLDIMKSNELMEPFIKPIKEFIRGRRDMAMSRGSKFRE